MADDDAALVLFLAGLFFLAVGHLVERMNRDAVTIEVNEPATTDLEDYR